MGEIADMMLDGTLDCVTGEYLGEGQGFPRTAEDRDDRDVRAWRKSETKRKARQRYRARRRERDKAAAAATGDAP